MRSELRAVRYVLAWPRFSPVSASPLPRFPHRKQEPLAYGTFLREVWRVTYVLGAVLIWSASESIATAQEEEEESSLVVVLEDACDSGDEPFSTASWLELARAELTPRQLLVANVAAPGFVHIVQECESASFELVLANGERRVQHVPLSDVPPPLRARVLSLAFAEFSHASVDDKDSAQAAPVATPKKSEASQNGAARDDELLEAFAIQAEPVRTVRLRLGAESRLFWMRPATFMWGGHGAFDVRKVSFTLTGLYRKSVHELGEAAVGLATVGVSAYLCQIGQRVRFACSAGGEIGATWGRGEPVGVGQGHLGFVPALSLLSAVSLALPLRRETYLSLRLGLGYASGIAGKVDGATLLRTGGPFMLLTLAVDRGVSP